MQVLYDGPDTKLVPNLPVRVWCSCVYYWWERAQHSSEDKHQTRSQKARFCSALPHIGLHVPLCKMGVLLTG